MINASYNTAYKSNFDRFEKCVRHRPPDLVTSDDDDGSASDRSFHRGFSNTRLPRRARLRSNSRIRCVL